MKKFVAAIIIICISMSTLCGCGTKSQGYYAELTQSKWAAELDGGCKVSLAFVEDNACLTIENADMKTEIKGKTIADEHSFVVFMPEIAQNYGFEYTPKGSTLELTFEGNTITLKKQ